MEKIKFDSGIREFRLGGLGVLRFSPTDPNLYARFLEAADQIQKVEEDLMARAKLAPQGDPRQAVLVLQEADRQMKKILSQAFGGDNDFEAILSGVSLLAVVENGKPLVTNLFDALQPILSQGAQKCLAGKKKQALEQAANRRKELGGAPA